MELKDRKRINNGLPGFVDGIEKVAPLDIRDAKPLKIWQDEGNGSKIGGLAGFMTNVSPYLSAAQFVTGLAADAINAVPTVDDLFSDAGTSTKYTNGISYQSVNDIDSDQYIKDYKKGAIFNPLKWFGLGKTKKRLAEFNKEKTAVNTAAMSGASTDYLQQEYAKEYGNPLSQMLYAKNGKDAVHTSEGEFNIAPNSKTEGGEIVYNQENSTAHVIPGKADGDKNYSAILPSDTIITNKYGLASRGRNAAKVLESLNKKRTNRGTLGSKTDELMKSQATAVLDDLAEEQKIYREAGVLPQSGTGKYKNGRLGNWWIDGLGALTHIGGLISDATQRIKRSNTYAENPYASNALNELASLRIDPYSINKQLMDQQRRNLYAINRAGGLSGAQKAYANIASGLGALGTIAASNADIQKQNNAYRSAYASAALNAGQADRIARTQANQWDLDYYSKAHGAKRQEIQQDIYNALAALQQGYANSWKRYSFDKMMSLYDNSYA